MQNSCDSCNIANVIQARSSDVRNFQEKAFQVIWGHLIEKHFDVKWGRLGVFLQREMPNRATKDLERFSSYFGEAKCFVDYFTR